MPTSVKKTATSSHDRLYSLEVVDSNQSPVTAAAFGDQLFLRVTMDNEDEGKRTSAFIFWKTFTWWNGTDWHLFWAACAKVPLSKWSSTGKRSLYPHALSYSNDIEDITFGFDISTLRCSGHFKSVYAKYANGFELLRTVIFFYLYVPYDQLDIAHCVYTKPLSSWTKASIYT